MLDVVEFLKEVYALVTGKIPVSLRIGQAEMLSEIALNTSQKPQSAENYTSAPALLCSR